MPRSSKPTLTEDRRWATALDEQHDLVPDRLLGEAQEQVAREQALDELVRLNQEMGLYDDE